jgi:hypothetical protein
MNDPESLPANPQLNLPAGYFETLMPHLADEVNIIIIEELAKLSDNGDETRRIEAIKVKWHSPVGMAYQIKYS